MIKVLSVRGWLVGVGLTTLIALGAGSVLVETQPGPYANQIRSAINALTTGGFNYSVLSSTTQRMLLASSSGAFQLGFRTAASGASGPACTINCGTGQSPSPTGTDVAFSITMGATGVPASPFTITFGATWTNTAPICTASMALSTMVVGKLPIALVASQTTLAVTTNGTAPGVNDVYSFHCFGTQ